MVTSVVLLGGIALCIVGFFIISLYQYGKRGKTQETKAQVIISTIILCTLPFLTYWTYKDQVNRFRRDESSTVLEYYNTRAKEMREEWGFPGIPRDAAVAIRNTQLLANPRSGNIIKIIKKGEQVNLFILADYVEEMLNEYKVGDWVKVNSDGEVGWVNGNNLRIMGSDELDQQVQRGIRTAIIFIFPDPSLWGIIKVLLIGLGITIFARVVGRFIEFIDKIHAIFPIAFFIVNGWEGRSVTFVEIGMIFWLVILLLAFIEGISYLVTHKLFGWE